MSLPYFCCLYHCCSVYHIVQPITSFGHSSRKCPLSIGFLNTSNFHHRAQFASFCCNCRESNLSSSIDLYHSSFHYSIHLVYSPPRFLSFFFFSYSFSLAAICSYFVVPPSSPVVLYSRPSFFFETRCSPNPITFSIPFYLRYFLDIQFYSISLYDLVRSQFRAHSDYPVG